MNFRNHSVASGKTAASAAKMKTGPYWSSTVAFPPRPRRNHTMGGRGQSGIESQQATALAWECLDFALEAIVPRPSDRPLEPVRGPRALPKANHINLRVNPTQRVTSGCGF